MRRTISTAFAVVVAACALAACHDEPAPVYDTVILHGRVMDPESALDATRSVAITGGKIQAVGGSPTGHDTIDAKGLIVAPGFIDLHQHAQHPAAYAVEAAGGITTAFELEEGTADVDRWYDERAGKATINYGVSVGTGYARMAVMHDPGKTEPTGDAATRAATPAEFDAILALVEKGLTRGAVAVGFPLGSIPAASSREVLEEFRIAKRFRASCHVHMRTVDNDNDIRDIEEVLSAALITVASLHIVHLNSSAQELMPQYLSMIGSAHARALDVTTEMYPYTASMSEIEGADVADWQTRPDEWFARLEWPATGERLTRATFARYRKQTGFVVAHPKDEKAAEAWILAGVRDPAPMFASDGILDEHGIGHPRVGGTFARVLGRYVRDEHALSLMDALYRMTLAPAKRLEARVPAMRDKGRVRVGADADLVLFDPATIADRATFREPTLPPAGIPFVFVNGDAVVRDGHVQRDARPGRPVRAAIAK